MGRIGGGGTYRVAGRVACDGDILLGASLDMAGRDRQRGRVGGGVRGLGEGQLLLELEGRFDHGGHETGCHVPFDVAVEEPDALITCVRGSIVQRPVMEKREGTGVIGSEAQYDVPVRAHHDGIPTHRELREGFVVDVDARFFGAADDGLEGVAVEVEGMFAGVHVVQHNFHDLVLFEDEGDGVLAVDGGVGGHVTRSQGGVERWDFGSDVGEVVEKGVIGAVAEVVHFHVEVEGVVNGVEDRFAVVGNEGKVVEWLEGFDESRCRKWSGFIVNEPAGDVGIEVFWDYVKQILCES